MFLFFIAHPFLWSQRSGVCSYFKVYLNGNEKLIKTQDQLNVYIVFTESSLVL